MNINYAEAAHSARRAMFSLLFLTHACICCEHKVGTRDGLAWQGKILSAAILGAILSDSLLRIYAHSLLILNRSAITSTKKNVWQDCRGNLHLYSIGSLEFAHKTLVCNEI
jgi:hypothetical protein